MIDVGYTKKDNFYENNYDKYNPRLSKFNNSFVEKNFKNFNKITEINFKAVGSLALGGLSNVWGGGAYNINKNLINELFQDIKLAFNIVVQPSNN